MRKILLMFAVAMLASCGGGGDGGGGGTTPLPESGSGWVPGVFVDASTFAAQCAAPRNGINPGTGQPFPDVQGMTVDENNFLRSYSNDTYLWYDEI